MKMKIKNVISVIVVSIIILFIILYLNSNLILNYLNKKEDFNDKIKIEYYSLSTCPHCVEFNPIWDKFSKENKNTVKYVIDKTDVNDKLDKYNIDGFPTIIVTKNGEKIDELEERTYEGLKELIKKNE
jgi:thiol-disulfide isomerase/thioredoxin